jgi:hypothetical protein
MSVLMAVILCRLLTSLAQSKVYINSLVFWLIQADYGVWLAAEVRMAEGSRRPEVPPSAWLAS